MLAVVVSLCASVIGLGCGAGSAPKAGLWPTPPGARVVLSKTTRSEVDTASDKTRYRTLLIAARDPSLGALERRTVAFAEDRGWRRLPDPEVPPTSHAKDATYLLASRDGRYSASVARPLSLVYDEINAAAHRSRRAGLQVVEVELFAKRS